MSNNFDPFDINVVPVGVDSATGRIAVDNINGMGLTPEQIRKAWDSVQQKRLREGSRCPHCGHCSACGRTDGCKEPQWAQIAHQMQGTMDIEVVTVLVY